ncbi:GntR family transcriptional regulator [Streptomyces sp. SCUT-3]|uniref:GntR family transcriptional regulator n=1 Tax=Streptomyces sp. SCUT-3 TaxID=2684469 RepID=UPI000CAC4FD9|nr:GntR family transcriptional regulator [Streptomyces sp. SCUT-3]PLW72251.1 ADP-ribose pyrophosphatase [Streptomyces sp. DJ]QMV23350.1 GntR family transcriptional regulator [Streptomyces sp. SCUT-3]
MGTTTARVEAAIRGRITSGELEPGAKLPSERTLTKELSAGRTTIRAVLARLVTEGLVEAQHGRGYFVAKMPTVSRSVVSNPAVELEPWKIHGERRIYDNRWVKLDLVDVEPPGTERFEHHVVRLHHVAISAVLDDQDRVLMLWRYRFVPQKWGWELPGGIVDAGEDAHSAALREVEEETGWRPVSLKHVTTYEPMVGMVESPHEIFVGRGAEHVGEPTDAEESGHVAWIPLKDVPTLMARGELLGSGTLVALLYLLASRE